MKISIMCQSTLLQEALRRYLKDNLSNFEDCDFIISDIRLKTDKPICLIDSSQKADIKKPFTQTSLLKDLQNFYYSKIKAAKITANPMPNNLLENPELKMQIDSILEEFSRKIYQTLKKHEK
ncbi:hypothetical protein [Helicobacter sp. 12S02232-10]|uniref:hypothetical protein n=1 Tax=Helicobacter sp. 12S02232-10 TaxID=1476197 RepID=UPI000BA713C5|nr:hypothetical protein [Helicobacter sp. 12S02232-10]